MRRFTVNTEKAKEDTLVYSGLLGISVIAIVQLLGTSVIDTPLTVSLYTFAVAIPMLAISIFAVTCEVSYKYTVIPFYMDIANFGGPLASIIGTAGLFWHFSRLIGITFLSFAVLGIIFGWKFDAAIERANADDREKEQATQMTVK